MRTASEQPVELHRHPGGKSGWLRDLILWLPGCLLLGGLAAWAAVDAQFFFAPLLLFPLLIGVLLGVLLVLYMRMARIGHRPTIVAGAVLAAGVTVVGMHYLAYRYHGREFEAESAKLERARQSLPPDAARRLANRLSAPPGSFFEYMKQQADEGRPILPAYSLHDGYAWLLWIVEALVLTAGALIVVVPALLLPFCRRCHSWYRTIRGVRCPPAVLGRLAAELHVEIPPRLRSGRCRLQACLGGCGPTRCELAWEDHEGQASFARVWLHHEQRNRVMQIFDQYAETAGKENKDS
jgi:hypothetical protein